MEKIYEYLDANKVDVLKITEDDEIPDDDLLLLEDEEEIEIDKIDLTTGRGEPGRSGADVFKKKSEKFLCCPLEEEIELAQRGWKMVTPMPKETS